LPQNGGNHVSEDLKFKNFPGEDAPPTPLLGQRLQLPHFVKPLFLKAWICASLLHKGTKQQQNKQKPIPTIHSKTLFFNTVMSFSTSDLINYYL